MHGSLTTVCPLIAFGGALLFLPALEVALAIILRCLEGQAILEQEHIDLCRRDDLVFSMACHILGADRESFDCPQALPQLAVEEMVGKA